MATEKNQEVALKSVTMEQVFMEAIRNPSLIPENLEKILALKERMDKTAAENAFNVAMAEFQSKIGVIVGTKDGSKTRSGEVVFKYAPFEQILPIIKKPLAESGLSISFKSELKDKIRKTTCTVTHIMGHSKESFFESERVEGTPLMSNLQKESSTLTHQERNALKMALFIVTEGEDDEDQLKNKNGEKIETITKSQHTLIEKQIGSTDETLYKAIMTEYKIDDLAQLPADKLDECKVRITKYKRGKREREKTNSEKNNQTNMEIAK